MQTIISEVAFTFVDDAIALVRGFGVIMGDITVETSAAARARILAPLDRLARACDVGGVLSAREAGLERSLAAAGSAHAAALKTVSLTEHCAFPAFLLAMRLPAYASWGCWRLRRRNHA
jgi:hypothetical protein